MCWVSKPSTCSLSIYKWTCTNVYSPLSENKITFINKHFKSSHCIFSFLFSTKKCIHKCTMHVPNVYDRVINGRGTWLTNKPFLFIFKVFFFISKCMCILCRFTWGKFSLLKMNCNWKVEENFCGFISWLPCYLYFLN